MTGLYYKIISIFESSQTGRALCSSGSYISVDKTILLDGTIAVSNFFSNRLQSSITHFTKYRVPIRVLETHPRRGPNTQNKQEFSLFIFYSVSGLAEIVTNTIMDHFKLLVSCDHYERFSCVYSDQQLEYTIFHISRI